MRRAQAGWAGRLRGAAGFTLLELLVVFAILATLSAVALPRLALGDGARLRSAAHTLAADLRMLRDEAARRGTATALQPVQAGYVLRPSGRVRRLPAPMSVVIEPTGPALVRQDEPAGAITFYPDGSSTGGVATLRLGAAAAGVSVAGLSGWVRLRE